MLTCHLYLLSNPVWPEMFGSQIYGFIFLRANFYAYFFTEFAISGWVVGGQNLGVQSSVWLLAPWLSQEVLGGSLEPMRFHGLLSPSPYI